MIMSNQFTIYTDEEKEMAALRVKLALIKSGNWQPQAFTSTQQLSVKVSGQAKQIARLRKQVRQSAGELFHAGDLKLVEVNHLSECSKIRYEFSQRAVSAVENVLRSQPKSSAAAGCYALFKAINDGVLCLKGQSLRLQDPEMQSAGLFYNL